MSEHQRHFLLESWIDLAIEERKRALARLTSCDSPRCMCHHDNDGAHQAPDCRCYRSHHAMIELGKINNRFASEVIKAFEND